MPSYRNIHPIRYDKRKKYSVIIPAAGEGVRMKSYGTKALINIGKETIIERQLRIIKELIPSHEIIVISGFQSDRIIKATPRDVIHIENESFETTNVAKSINMGLKAATTTNVLIIYGDLVFNKEAIQTPFNETTVVLAENTMGEEEVGCTANGGLLENMMYGLTTKWAQIAFFTGLELKKLERFANDPTNHNCYGFELINKVINDKGNIRAITPRKIKVVDVDTTKDIEKAESI